MAFFVTTLWAFFSFVNLGFGHQAVLGHVYPAHHSGAHIMDSSTGGPA